MEGNAVDIPIKGIGRFGSDLSSEDGLCTEMIGLEFKDGIFVPSGFEGVSFGFQNPDVIGAWIHKTSIQNNVIYKTSNNKFYWSEVPLEPMLIQHGIFITEDPADKINIINNLISIGNKNYLFTKDSSISQFGIYNEINPADIKFDMQLDCKYNGVALLHSWVREKNQEDFVDPGQTWEGTKTKMVLTQLASEVESKNYLVGMAYMRYAIKLYDGTYINASIPTLVSDTYIPELNKFKNQYQLPGSINFRGDEEQDKFEPLCRMIGYLVNTGWKWKFKSTSPDSDFKQQYEKNPEYREKRLYDVNSMLSDETFFKEDIPFNKENTWCRIDDYNTFKVTKISDLKKNVVTFTENGLGYSSSELNNLAEVPNKTQDAGHPHSFKVWASDELTSYTEADKNWYIDKKGPEGMKEVILNDMTFHNVPGEYCYREKGLGVLFDPVTGDIHNAGKKTWQFFAARNLATPTFRILGNIDKSYRNLIVSVDVFMTRPVSMFEKDMDYQGSDESNQRKFKTESKIKEELADSLGTFYQIYSIPFDKLVDLEENTIYVPYIEPGRISAIEQQIRLDSGYPHIDSYKKSYMYNNRLHIADLVTNMKEDIFPSIIPIRQQKAIINPKRIINKVYVKVILSDSMVSKDLVFKMDYGDLDYSAFVSFYSIIYPDVRIKEIRFLAATVTVDNVTKTFKMTGSYSFESKNGYSCYQDFAGADISTLITSTEVDIPIGDNKIDRDDNLFKVSSTNSMLKFPLAQTYQVGHGKIVGFASSTRALSQGQFGQYPLYVFTTEGIYSMEVEPTGAFAYRSSTPISREVCNNPNSIVEIDGAVIFSTNKGLMYLQGTEVQPFADHVNGEINITPKDAGIAGDGLVLYNRAINMPQLVELKGSLSAVDFRKYIGDIDTYASYAYEKGKIIVFNKKYDYAYVIDIATRTTTKINEKIIFSDNNYPIENYATKQDGYVALNIYPYIKAKAFQEGMFFMRPIKLGTYNFKSSYRVVLRGKFKVKEGKHAGIYVMGSQDGVNWMYLGGTEKSGEFTDLGTTIERYSTKYISILYVGNLSPDSKINGLEIDSGVKYNNKLR